MDKNLFLKNMEEMIQIAKTNGNQIDHKELLDYFSDYELNEEAKKLLIASFVEAGIRVLGVDEAQIVAEEEAKEKADISEESVLRSVSLMASSLKMTVQLQSVTVTLWSRYV